MEAYQFDPNELAVIESSCIPFAVYQYVDKHVVTLALSQGFCDLFGLQRDEAYYLANNNLFSVNHPDDVARIAEEALRFSTEGGDYDITYRARSQGEYFIVHAQGKHVHRENGARLAFVWYTYEGAYVVNGSSGKSERHRVLSKALHEHSLYQVNYFDHLTGLPSMSYFFERADIARNDMRAAGVKPAVLFFNLVDMKHFNHKHGFAEGDALIKAVARILADSFGDYGCCRFGKDQFAAIADEAGLEEKLRGIFDACARINGGDSLPIRVGICRDCIDKADIGTACDRAKYACDLNREAYESQFRYFDETMLADIENRQYFIDNLDKALEENWIKVFYQPIVRAANGKVCDEEALARWYDPARGCLSPGEFIPVLEDARLIYKLDLYVLEQVLAKIQRLSEAGMHIVAQSLNLSREDFYSVDIVEEVCKRVDAAGVAHDKITIEITESTIGRDFGYMKAQVKRFQDLGFQVWMDDFGSGYSTLDLLQNIRFDLIKLDMQFMKRFDEGEASKVILTELVRMAVGLGIDTVTEGVETAEQVRFLREIGCSKLQGFHYCKPIPEDEIFERNRLGLQIGFENPEEADYYAAIGSVNLYDPAVIVQEIDEGARKYFDTIPMAVYEVAGDEFRITRSNKSYRDYISRAFGIAKLNLDEFHPLEHEGESTLFQETLRQVSENGNTVVLDEDLDNDETSHSIVRRVSVNPVSGNAALVVAVMAIVDSENHRAATTYANIAQALSSDYSYLYYIDLDTENFVEYSSSGKVGDLSAERHGIDFFERSRLSAQRIFHEQDQDPFVALFTKENVLRAIDEQGVFITQYRQIVDGVPIHMLMKAVRMNDGKHLILGVSNVEARTRQEEIIAHMRADQLAYTRLNALSDDYLRIYIVDLATGRFEKYSEGARPGDFGRVSVGDDFFATSDSLIESTIHEDDQVMFASAFTENNVVRIIADEGSFTLDFRLLIGDEMRPVTLKAAIVDEPDGQRLVVGVKGRRG